MGAIMQEILDSLTDQLVTSATAATILAIIAYFMRDLIAKFLSQKTEHRHDKKISILEDKLVRERAAIADLRGVVVSGINSRNEKLLEKQISATEELWRAAIINKKHQMATQFLQSLNIDKMNEHIKEHNVQELVDITAKMTGVQKLIEEVSDESIQKPIHSTEAELTRPFVSALSWALYSAHSQTIMHAVVTIISWKNGVSTNLLKNDDLVKAIEKALPHQTKFLQEYGVGGTYFLLQELEDTLLKELRRFLREGEAGQEAAKQAREILSASEQAQITHPSSAPK
jgi:hypothetical protein